MTGIKRTTLSDEQERRLFRCYVEEELPLSTIRERFGVSDGIVKKVVERLGGTVRPKGQQMRRLT